MLRRGSVIWFVIPDPDGNVIYDDHGNPKEHPALVLSSNEDIDSGRTLVVAAISTRVGSNPRPPQWFHIDWQRGGHPGTGLSRHCVVKADWLVSVDQADVTQVSPGISGRATDSVLKWLKTQQ